MTNVYVDVEVASIAPGRDAAGGGSTNGAGEGSWAANPEAVRALGYLTGSGVQVVLVTAGGVRPSPELEEVASATASAVPAQPPTPSWYLTSEIERCLGSSARLRTVLIGGTPPNGSVRRCDAVARDVQAAAMEILASDAMGARTHDAG